MLSQSVDLPVRIAISLYRTSAGLGLLVWLCMAVGNGRSPGIADVSSIKQS